MYSLEIRVEGSLVYQRDCLDRWELSEEFFGIIQELRFEHGTCFIRESRGDEEKVFSYPLERIRDFYQEFWSEEIPFSGFIPAYLPPFPEDFKSYEFSKSGKNL